MPGINERRSRLVDVFNDTLKYIDELDSLKEVVQLSIKETRFYPSDIYFDLSNHKKYETKIEVTGERSFESTFRIQKENKNYKIGVLNFASATTPGGGVTKGSSAQEESLCRCSTLYPILNTDYLNKEYYQKNRDAHNPLHTDDVIYTPHIKIIKTDEDFPQRLKKDEFNDVDILSCAAPNLRNNPTNAFNFDDGEAVSVIDEELYKIHLSRAKHIMNIAAYHNIDVLILGAFGCGAFKNNPKVVASAYKEALKEYAKYFQKVVFAVFCRSYNDENYRVFKEIL